MRWVLVVVCVLCAGVAHAQSVNQKYLPEHPAHESVSDFYDSLRILRVEVLNYNPATGVVDARFEDGKRIDILMYQVTKTTYINGELKGDILIVYCAAAHGTGPNDRIKYLLQTEPRRDGSADDGR